MPKKISVTYPEDIKKEILEKIKNLHNLPEKEQEFWLDEYKIMSQWEWTQTLSFANSEIERNELSFENLDKTLIDIPADLIKKLEQQAKKKWLSYHAFVKSILYNAVNK